jgi:hypothetical protein
MPYRVAVSEKGWTDQGLGLLWLQKDFEPSTRDKLELDEWRLLILDGHNSHCSLEFLTYAEKMKILILCLPAHITHALQPCDRAIFSPLATFWKKVVTEANHQGEEVTKSNFLSIYHMARTLAMKPTTIATAFAKTGIYPFNREIIPDNMYELAKNTTTESAQPVPAILPNILTPLSTGPATPDNSEFTSSIPSGSSMTSTTSSSTTSTEPHYALILPDAPGRNASNRMLRTHINELMKVCAAAKDELARQHGHLVLMDKENGVLRKKIYEKKKASKRRFATGNGHARHLTSREQLVEAARERFKAAMKGIHQSLRPRFKAIRADITRAEKEAAKQRAAEEREAMGEIRGVARRGRGRGRGCSRGAGVTRGTRRGGCGRGGRGRGGRGRGRGGRSGRRHAVSDSGNDSDDSGEASSGVSEEDGESEVDEEDVSPAEDIPASESEPESDNGGPQRCPAITRPRPRPNWVTRNPATAMTSAAGVLPIVAGSTDDAAIDEGQIEGPTLRRSTRQRKAPK